MNYYPHHIGDFNNATRHLSRLERSIYRDMIDLYYDSEKPLTLDHQSLCRKLLARTEEESTAVEQVLNEFFTKTEHGWHHERCEKEISEYKASISAKSAAGKASAAKREEFRLKRLSELNKCSLTDEHMKNTCKTDVQQVLNSVDSFVQLTKNQEPRTNNNKQEDSKTEKTDVPKKPRNSIKSFLPNDFKVSQRVEAWAKEKGYANLERHLENFVSVCKAKGYQYVDFDEALMNAIRNNWAKVETTRSTNAVSSIDPRWRGAK